MIDWNLIPFEDNPTVSTGASFNYTLSAGRIGILYGITITLVTGALPTYRTLSVLLNESAYPINPTNYFCFCPVNSSTTTFSYLLSPRAEPLLTTNSSIQSYPIPSNLLIYPDNYYGIRTYWMASLKPTDNTYIRWRYKEQDSDEASSPIFD